MTPLLVVLCVFAAGAVVLRPGAETGACAAERPAVVERVDCDEEVVLERCRAARTAFRSVAVQPRRGRRALRLAFRRRVAKPVRIDVFQVSAGRRVVRQNFVARFAGRRKAVRWSGRAQRGRPRVRDGYLFARFRIRAEDGRRDTRRVTLQRRGGRFYVRKPFFRRASCGALTAFKLERPVFGGRRPKSLGVSFVLARAGRVKLEIRRGGKVVRRFAERRRRAKVKHRLRVGAKGLRRGRYEVRLTYAGDQGSLRSSLYAQRL
jgi:hypothetical protein